MQLRVTYFPFELLYSKPRDASLVRPAFLSLLPVASLLLEHGELTMVSRDCEIHSRGQEQCTVMALNS